MELNLERVDYRDLSGKQKEVYNFQKVAAHLADYGYNCIKLDDDWQGADFLAYHKDGDQTLKVQLKSRLTIAHKYQNKDLYICFPHYGEWYLIPHDGLIEIVGRLTPWLNTDSWQKREQYFSARPSQALLSAIDEFKLA